MARRIVITDVHGCYHSFKSLVEKEVKLKKEDSLYLLGDYINKGPFSKDVLDYIFQLRDSGYKLHLLRGNHEEEVLDYLKGKSDLDTLISKGAKTFFNNFDVKNPQGIPDKYIEFFKSLDYFFELDDFFLVHAGFDFSAEDPFKPSKTMLTIRGYDVDLTKTKNKLILHGHTPTAYEQIKDSLLRKNDLHFSLDAGCTYKNDNSQARLIALDLDIWKLYVQPNIDESDNYDW